MDEQLQQPASESEISAEQGITKFFKKFPSTIQSIGLRKTILLISLCIVAVAGIAYFLLTRQPQTNSIIVKSVKAATYFTVVSTTPSNSTKENASDTQIKITFSEPVKPDALRSFFTVNPMVPGKFSQGASSKEVVFQPDYTFGDNTVVKVILNRGFESIAGNQFRSDYTFSFYTKTTPDSVNFGIGELYSQLTNLSVGQDVTINVYAGSAVTEDGVITIYKGDVQSALASLTYNNQVNAGSNYVTKTFGNSVVDTSHMQVITQIHGLKDSSTFDFKQDAGLYYITATSKDNVVGHTWVNVTNQGLLVRQDDQKLDIATQNILTGDNNQTVDVQVYSLNSKVNLLQEKSIQKNGEIPMPFSEQADLVVGATSGGDIALVPLNIPQTQADIRSNIDLSTLGRIYMYTNKPTYSPGETVQYTGIVRMDNDAQYTMPPAGTKVRIWIPDPNNSNVNSNAVDQTVTVGDGGVISGQFTIPVSFAPSGNMTVTSITMLAKVVSDNATYYSSRSYTTFDVVAKNDSDLIKVTFDSPSYTKNQNITGHILGLDAQGNPLSGKSVTYSIYEKKYYENDPASVANFGADWGDVSAIHNQTVILDTNGKADISISETKETVSQAVTLEATATIDNEGVYGAKTILVEQGNLVLTFAPARDEYHYGETTITRVYATDLQGNIQTNTPLNYEMYLSEYDSSTQGYKERIIQQGSATTDTTGLATIIQPITESADTGDTVYVRVTGADTTGNVVEADSSFSVIPAGGSFSSYYYHSVYPINFDITTDKRSYAVGDTAKVTINSSFEQNAFVTYESGRIYHSEWITLHSGDNQYAIPITPELSPSFNLILTYFNNGKVYVEGIPFTITDQTTNLAITAKLDKTTYVASDTAQLTITTRDSKNTGIPAHVSVNILPNDIFNLRDILPSGSIAWLYYQPRDIETNFSSSVLGIGTGGGCGGGSGYDINYVPNRTGANLYWNPDQITDATGSLTLTIPLAGAHGLYRIYITGTTDSTAVGQLQSTLRVQ